jgi:transposase
VEGTTDASQVLREILHEMMGRLDVFAERLQAYDRRIAVLARNDQQTARLMAVEGVGPITATALAATVGDARQFQQAAS